jgi:hypothetical protein
MPTRCRIIRKGRSPANPIRAFVARLLAEVDGISIKRSMAAITANANRAPGCLWAAAVDAYVTGCRTLQDFEAWPLTQLSK